MYLFPISERHTSDSYQIWSEMGTQSSIFNDFFNDIIDLLSISCTLINKSISCTLIDNLIDSSSICKNRLLAWIQHSDTSWSQPSLPPFCTLFQWQSKYTHEVRVGTMSLSLIVNRLIVLWAVVWPTEGYTVSLEVLFTRPKEFPLILRCIRIWWVPGSGCQPTTKSFRISHLRFHTFSKTLENR